ncbi:hypothetical protein [Nocardioides antri]|uniref:ARB-07466-like C-terminal domain-containing protein n=1 Tax=Nocardioides antri TaxID=2607659 RepID=A0A5B1M1L8_9ACTN|nr:hypothetical protein [Nocardioides antri]KAA1425707.1 hypothetical protein F0U47_18160 [Nocardioides antri]
MKGRVLVVAVCLAALMLVVVIGVVVFNAVEDIVSGPDGDCSATVDDHEVEISGEQAENATLIAAIAIERGLPARAVSIALATAFQESKLVNIDYGDRDSIGLFQQRPSQGWGTEEQILDREYATNAFYDALVQVDGYENMAITEAAQRVQRSAFPDAYADHEADARALASALTGFSPAAFSCDLDGGAPSADEDLVDTGLTARADEVRTDLLTRFGELDLGGFAPGGVSNGHMEGSAHYEGRAVDVFFRPVNDANQTRGWAVAHYLVGNAARLEIRTVIFDDRIWTAGRDGWRDYDPPERDGSAEILEHRDHVHVDVFG